MLTSSSVLRYGTAVMVAMTTAFGAPAAARAETDDPIPSGATIAFVGSSDERCNGASAISPDKTISTVLFSALTAIATKGDSKTSCSLRWRVSRPAGYTLALKDFSTNSFVSLDSGATASIHHEMSIGGSIVTTPDLRFDTPGSQIPGRLRLLDKEVFAPCFGDIAITLNLGLTANAAARKGDAYVAVETAEVSLHDAVWQRCS
jgi:Domain of unknown function (DUF4360)